MLDRGTDMQSYWAVCGQLKSLQDCSLVLKSKGVWVSESVSQWVSEWVSEWQDHLLSCSGQLKTGSQKTKNTFSKMPVFCCCVMLCFIPNNSIVHIVIVVTNGQWTKCYGVSKMTSQTHIQNLCFNFMCILHSKCSRLKAKCLSPTWQLQ